MNDDSVLIYETESNEFSQILYGNSIKNNNLLNNSSLSTTNLFEQSNSLNLTSFCLLDCSLQTLQQRCQLRPAKKPVFKRPLKPKTTQLKFSIQDYYMI